MRERGGSVSHVQVGWRYKSRVRGVEILICDFAQIAAHRFFVWFGARQLSLGDAQLSLNAMSHGDCYLQFTSRIFPYKATPCAGFPRVYELVPAW